MAYLALLRHTESNWNKKNVWTGLADVSLDKKGIEKAKKVADLIKDIKFDFAYTSFLKRTRQTFETIAQELEWKMKPIESEALNERDYGIYTGKNKWEIQKKVGDLQFQRIRRGWDVAIENGESLKDVYDRAVFYYRQEILPKLKENKNVLIVAHGNSLRALTKYLENISDKDISNLEIETGEVNLFEVDANGNIVSKKILKKDA